MNYAFGTANQLYQDCLHPRIAFGFEDVAILRERISDGDGCKVMAALRQKVALLADAVLAVEHPEELVAGSTSHHSLVARLGFAIDDIGIVALLDEDERALAAMRKLFEALISAPPDSFRHARVSAASLALAYDYLHPQLSASMREEYCRIAVTETRRRIEQTRDAYLQNAAANIPMHLALKAVETILAIQGEPGVPPLDDELAWLVRCLEASVQAAVGPQGYPEEDTGYGTLVTARLVQYLEWVRRAGIVDLYERCPHLLRFGQAILHLVEPWGEDLANTGDHGDDFGQREFVLARLAAETGDPTLLWLLGTLHYHHGKVLPENRLPDFWVEVPLREGVRIPACWRSLLVLPALADARHPRELDTPTAFSDPQRGVAAFRDSWREDATFLFVDGCQRSAAGQGHAHSNAGHFILSARGEYFSIGPGRYQIDQDQQSVVLMDGRSSYSTDGHWHHAKRAGVLLEAAPGDSVDYAAVDASHQYEGRWARRHLGLVKGNDIPGYLWTVEDLNKADDWAEYWWQLQSSPENTIELRPHGATIRGWRYGNCLDVHLVAPPRASVTWHQDLSTSSSWRYLTGSTTLEELAARYARPADMVHGPAFINPRLIAKVHDLSGRFMTLLLPRDRDAAPATVEPLDCLANTLAVRITFEACEDTLIFAYEHRLLEAPGIVARGDWCHVRRHRASGKVLAHTVHNGKMLQLAAGHPLATATRHPQPEKVLP